MSDDLSKDMLARLSQLEMFAAHVADWAGNPLLLIKARAMLDATAHDVAKPTPAEHANGVYDPDCTACREYAEPVMGNPISDPIAKRMEALVRKVADAPRDSVLGESSYASEARAIVALLPEPVDADLVECRKVLAERYPDSAQLILAGHWDKNAVGDSLACVQHIRALERGSREG